MARFIIIAILALPLIEIAVLIKVGQTIGLWPTLGLLIAAGLGGVMLLRQQGISVLTRMRSNVQSGQMPGRAVADAMMIGLASVFLVLPGFLSDIVAIALLLPAVRSAIYAWLAGRVVVVGAASSGQRRGPTDPRVNSGVKRPDTIDLDEGDYRRD